MMRQTLRPTEKVQVRHVGILELDDFYRWMKRWLKFKGYWQGEGCETDYAEEIVGPGVKHIRLTLKTWKNPTPYVKVNIKIDYIHIAVTNEKIEVEGKQVKVFKGDFDFRFALTIERTGEVPPFWRRVYDWVVNKHEIDHIIQEAYDDFYELTNQSKEICNQYA